MTDSNVEDLQIAILELQSCTTYFFTIIHSLLNNLMEASYITRSSGRLFIKFNLLTYTYTGICNTRMIIVYTLRNHERFLL